MINTIKDIALFVPESWMGSMQLLKGINLFLSALPFQSIVHNQISSLENFFVHGDSVQAHNNQVWIEFSNIKDTYLKRLFRNIQKRQRIRKTWPFTSKPKALRNVSKYFYLLCNMKRKSISFHQPISTWWQWSLATVIPSGNVPSVWAACVSWSCQREVFPQKARWINTHESWWKQGCRIVFV